jgi:hypothetical protein
MASMREVWAAYERARGRWCGCDWPTRFGSLCLDLEGVSALRARAVARRWRAIAAGEADCEAVTAQEHAALGAMGLCLRLQSPGVRRSEDGAALAPTPPQCRCAEALAREWELAACVLAEIESDASLAEREAWAAVQAAVRGDWGRAARHVRSASALEAGYVALDVWGGLRRAIEAAALAGALPAAAAEDDPRVPLAEPDGGASSMTQQKERDLPEAEPRETSERLIAAVLRALGRPDDLRSVQVRRLWGVHYRVNVLTGPDAGLASIAHSYFLTTDGAGKILDASPEIVRRY